MKNWLIVLIIIFLALNVIVAFSRQNSEITFDKREENRIKQAPLDYESFKDQWGTAWLGLEVTDVPPEIAARAMLDKRLEGAFVKNVTADSPAAKAGITPGGVILSYNGRKIRTAEQFQGDVLGSEIGSEVYMCVMKDALRITVYVVLEERPPYLPAPTKTFPFLGIIVSEVVSGTDEAEKLGEVDKDGGIWVEKVIYDSPAEKAGIQEGDIIMSFNHRKTRTLREFFSDLAGSQVGAQVSMCLMRVDYRQTIYVTLGTNSMPIGI